MKIESDDGSMVLYQGDCLEVMPTLEAGSIDMVLTDPPYGTTACKWDSVIPLEPMWGCLKHVAKKNAAIVMTASQPFTSVLGASNISMLKYGWYWRKSRATGHLNAKKMPMKDIEDCLVFYRSVPTYRPQGTLPCNRKMWNSKSDSLRGKATDPTSVVRGGYRTRRVQPDSHKLPKAGVGLCQRRVYCPPHPKTRRPDGIPHQDLHQRGRHRA